MSVRGGVIDERELILIVDGRRGTDWHSIHAQPTSAMNAESRPPRGKQAQNITCQYRVNGIGVELRHYCGNPFEAEDALHVGSGTFSMRSRNVLKWRTLA